MLGGHYDAYDRLPEKRVALDAWARHVEDLLAGDEVDRRRRAARPRRRAMSDVLIDRLRRLGASSESEIVNHDSREHRVVEVPMWILDELLIHLEELERGRRGRRMTKIGRWTNRIAEALADPKNTMSKTEWLARASKALRLKARE